MQGVGIFVPRTLSNNLQKFNRCLCKACGGQQKLGSGCDTVGSAVASDTRGPGSISSHRQLLLDNYSLLTVCTKDEKFKKRPRKAHF